MALMCLLICVLPTEFDRPPNPNLNEPVDYLAWLDGQFSVHGRKNAAETYNAAFALFAGSESGQELAKERRAKALTPEERAELQLWVEKNRQCLKVFSDASRIPDCYFLGKRPSRALLKVELPYLKRMAAIGQLLVARAGLRLANRETDDAMADICTLLRVGNHLRSQPRIIEYFAGERMTILALELLLDLPLLAGDRVDYGATLRLVAAADPVSGPPTRQMEAERLLFLDILQRDCEDVNGDGLLDRMKPSFGGFVFGKPQSLETLVKRYDKIADRWNDVLSASFAEGARLAEDLHKEKEELPRFDPVSMLQPMYWGFSKSFRRTVAVRNASRIILWMHAFRGDEGRWPNSIAEASAGILSPQVRHDPFSATDLVYRLSKGEPLLYSIGLNGKDDDGRRLSTDHNAWAEEGDHVFWPRRP